MGKWQKAQISCIPPFSCYKSYDVITLPKIARFTKNYEFCLAYGSLENRIKLKQRSQFLVNSDQFR